MTEISASAVKELREKTGAGMMLCKKALGETNGDVNAAIDYLRKQGEITAGKRAERTAKEGKVGIAAKGLTTVMLELNSETDFVAKNDDFNALLNGLLEVALDKKPRDVDSFKIMAAAAFGERTVQEAVSEKSGIIGEKIDIRRVTTVEGDSSSRVFSYIHMGGKIGVLLKLAGTPTVLEHAKVLELGKDICMQIAASSPLAANRDEIPADKIESEKAIYRELSLKEGKPEKMLDKIVAGRLEKFYKENVLTEQLFVKDNEKSINQVIAACAKEAGGEIKVMSFVRYQLGVSA
ncbi:MAG: translation elongation factor Ts [Elusimicrobia bacterium RIFOXYB2_FULL_49_7]|nr:MAG: translation elongation factor Ts [Elusimicrobia bacterium RIFOXYB2_FULL_49_7]